MQPIRFRELLRSLANLPLATVKTTRCESASSHATSRQLQPSFCSAGAACQLLDEAAIAIATSGCAETRCGFDSRSLSDQRHSPKSDKVMLCRPRRNRRQRAKRRKCESLVNSLVADCRNVVGNNDQRNRQFRSLSIDDLPSAFLASSQDARLANAPAGQQPRISKSGLSIAQPLFCKVPDWACATWLTVR